MAGTGPTSSDYLAMATSSMFDWNEAAPGVCIVNWGSAIARQPAGTIGASDYSVGPYGTTGGGGVVMWPNKTNPCTDVWGYNGVTPAPSMAAIGGTTFVPWYIVTTSTAGNNATYTRVHVGSEFMLIKRISTGTWTIATGIPSTSAPQNYQTTGCDERGVGNVGVSAFNPLDVAGGGVSFLGVGKDYGAGRVFFHGYDVNSAVIPPSDVQFLVGGASARLLVSGPDDSASVNALFRAGVDAYGPSGYLGELQHSRHILLTTQWRTLFSHNMTVAELNSEWASIFALIPSPTSTTAGSAAADASGGSTPPSSSGFAYVNGSGLKSARNTSTFSYTLGWTPVAGNTLVVTASCYQNTGHSAVTVTDSTAGGAGTWQNYSWSANANADAVVAVLPAMNSVPTSVTINVGSGSYVEYAVSEFSGGINPADALRVQATAIASPAGSSLTITTGSSPVVGDLALTALTYDVPSGACGITTPSGYTATFTQSDANVTIAGAGAYKVVTTSGANSAAWTYNNLGSSAVSGLLVVLKYLSPSALTGTTGTLSIGAVAARLARSLTSATATTAVGSVSFSGGSAGSSAALTGRSATGAVGTVRAQTAVPLVGVMSASAVGAPGFGTQGVWILINNGQNALWQPINTQ